MLRNKGVFTKRAASRFRCAKPRASGREVRGVKDISDRLAAVRKHMGLSQEEFASRMDTPYRTYQGYEHGKFAPKIVHLMKLRDLGINVDWLLFGDGDMFGSGGPVPLPPPEPATPRPTNTVLLGRVIDGVLATYKAAGQSLAPVNQGAVVGPIYDDLVGIEDEVEQRGALKYALSRLSQDLIKSAADPTSTKRRA